ncbi:ribosomal protein S5 domain 2-type protein [Armillaria mellea]|nr:ribosomal protein S5 domain 2-type protein [Armillaria mellea]
MSISKAEKAYIQTGLLSNPPRRQDGRPLLDFRAISLETGVLAASKLQVDDEPSVTCTVTCSPSAYPHLAPSAIEDAQADLTALLHSTLAPHRPANLAILPGKKAWALHLDVLVLADAGNLHDALFLAARAALCDTRVPRTRAVEYKARKDTGFDTRAAPADWELPDYWDEGEVLAGGDAWPVCVTLNVESPSVHYLDAGLQEEASTPLRLLLLTLPHIKALLADGEKYAWEIMLALNAKLKEEDLRRNQKARVRFEQRF